MRRAIELQPRTAAEAGEHKERIDKTDTEKPAFLRKIMD
jgi:hypothetical protein